MLLDDNSIVTASCMNVRAGRSHDRFINRYARVSTDAQDLTARCNALQQLGVGSRTYLDHGLTGTNRQWPGLCRGSSRDTREDVA
jgi:hypothetical protein